MGPKHNYTKRNSYTVTIPRANDQGQEVRQEPEQMGPTCRRASHLIGLGRGRARVESLLSTGQWFSYIYRRNR